MKINTFVLRRFLLVVIFLTISFFAWNRLVAENGLRVSGGQDWDQRYVYAESSRISLLTHNQLPLWNSYHCGGLTQIGNPQNDIFSANLISTLLFGPIVGYKLMFFVYMFIGLAGFYSLGISFGISTLGSILLACTYMFSGLMILPFAVGMTAFLNIALLPWLYLFYISALGKNAVKFILLCSVTLALFFLNGFHYLLLPVMFLLVVALIKSFSGRSLKPLLILATVIAIFLPLVAVKLLPSLETLRLNSHFTRDNQELTSGYSLKSLTMALLSPEQTFDAFFYWGQFDKNSFYDGISYMIDESGMYVGAAGVLLFFIGIFYQRKKWQLLIIFIIFLVLGFGLNLQPSPYGMLHSLPLVENMRVAQRYRYLFMIPFVLFVGYGFDFIFEKSSILIRKKVIRHLIFSSLIIWLVYHQSSVNLSYFARAFNYFHKPLAKSSSFVQGCGDALEEHRLVQAGYGARNCSEPITVNVAARCQDEEGYRGEFYLKNASGDLSQASWSQNRIAFAVNTDIDDTIIVNQNYAPGWKVLLDNKIKKDAVNEGGLLAAEVGKNNQTVVFYYQPDSFVTGAYVSLTGLILVVLFLIKRRFDFAGDKTDILLAKVKVGREK